MSNRKLVDHGKHTKEGLGYGAGVATDVSQHPAQLAQGSNLPYNSHLQHDQIKVSFSDRTTGNSDPTLPITRK